MRPLFPEEGALKLLFTDTDSLAYAMRTDDMFDAMSSQAHEIDFSNLPADNNSFSLLNKMTPGKMKDESKGSPMLEFVGLRAKAYSYTKLVDASSEGDMPPRKVIVEDKRLKGIARNVVRNEISHAHYLACLQEHHVMMAKMGSIRSVNHQLYTIEQVKKALSFYDDKRHIMEDSITTTAI